MLGSVRDKFGDSLDQVGWFCFNTVGSGGIEVKMGCEGINCGRL